MSKKRRVVFGVGYKVEEQSAKSLEKVAKDIQTKLGKAIGDSANKELQTIIDGYKNIKKIIDGFDGEKISPKAFDQVNDALNKTTKEFDNFLKKITGKIGLDIDVDALKELDDEINELEKSLSDLDDKMKLGSKLSTQSGERDFTKTLMDSKMEKKFPGFTGKTDSLEIAGLHKNRVEYEAISKAYDQMIAKQSKLENSTKTLTKAQKEELETIQSPANQEKIKMLKEVLDSVDAETKAEKRKQEQYTKDHAKFVEEHDEKIAKRQELISLSGTEAGEILSGASGAVSGAKTDLGRSKLKKDVDTEEHKDQQRYLESLKRQGSGTEKALDGILEKYFSVTAGLRLLNSVARKTIDIISDLDAAFVSISVVTQYTNKQVWGMYDSFSNIASAAGFTVGEIGKVASEYFRQGESYTNVLTLTEAAAKSAQVAGIDAADSVRYLTSAVKGYSLAASEAMTVSDKFAALAASTATNYEGLATAMSKVAAQASANSVEMDNLMGMMATAMEVTQEAPENIGTAFKTILARMSEIKDYGKVLEDGVDANRIEKALKTVGVQLFDNNNEMRALDDVLLEVGAGWGTLNRSQKAYIATSLAGTRQQTRLLAVLENMEMTEKNIQTSRDSAGATEAQQLKNTESLAYNFNRINVAFERFTKNMAKNTWILAAVKGFASTIEAVVGLTDTFAGQIAVATLAIGAFGKALHYAITLPKFVEMASGALETAKAMKILGMQTKVASGAFSLLGKAGMAVGKSFMFLLPYVTVAAVGVLAVVAAFKTWKYFSPEKQIERTAEAINKLNGELYNIRESKSTTEELIKEFKELEAQVIKTNESLLRQAEIIQLLEDADVDGDYKFRDAAGGLNLEEVERYQSDLRKEEEKLFKEKMDNGLKLVERYDKLTDQVNKLNAAEALAIKELANGSLEEWEKVDDAIKKMAADAAKANLDSGEQTYLKADGSYYMGDVTTTMGSKQITDEHGTTRTLRWDTYTGEDGEELTTGLSVKAMQQIHEYKEALDTSKVSMAEYNEELRKIAPEHLLMADAMFASSESFRNSSDISIDGMERLQKVVDMLRGHNIDLSEEQEKALIESYDPSRPEAFFSRLQQLYANTEEATASFAHAAIQMQGIFENMSFENLVDGLTSFESLEVQIDKVNDSMDQFNAQSLKGAMDLMEQYREYPELIGAMAEQLINLGHISDETQEAMLNAEKQKQLESIQMKIDENEASIKIKQAEVDMYLRAAEAEGELAEIASAHQIDVSSMSASEIAQHLQTLGGDYQDLFQGILDAATEVGNKLPAALSGEVQSLTTNVKTGKGNYTSNADKVTSMVDKLKGAAALAAEEVAQLSAQNKFLDAAMKKIDSGTWNKSMKEIEKAAKGAGSATKDAAEAVEYYIGKLNKLYVAQKRLEVVNWGQGLLEAKKSYIEAANAVEGLDGAQRNLTKESVAQVNEDLFFAYQLEKEELQNLVKVSEEYQNQLEKDLNPALRDSYQIINGRVIPVTSKYKKLTAEQMETVDKFAESFNGLTTEIESYTEGMWAAETAQNEIIKTMRDRVIEFEETMIAAIKNQEKKQIESFKAIIDANKKYIAERKKLYEKGFEDEDNEKEEQDIAEQRQALIEKLATLEAAHDLTSVQKKEAYKKELAELDDQFNNLMLERNREALLQSLDNQIEYQDDVYTKEEEAYNARIESGEWLEARIKEITDQARLQAIIDTISHDMTIQKMLEDGYIDQETATRLGEEALSKTISELSEEQYGILKDYWGKNWDVVNEMWNGVGDKYGAEELSQKAMDNILKFLEDHSTGMEGATSNMRQKVLNEWRGLLTDVMAYTNHLNSLEIKSPDYSHLSRGLSNMLGQIRVTADAAELEYKRIMDNNKKSDAARASELSKQQAHNRQLENLRKEAPSSSSSGSYRVGGLAMPREVTYMPMATGGTTERTGLHWLDGKPGAPERVLSPGANKQFEILLGSLVVESRQNAAKGSVGDNSEVVNTLMSVVKAVYDSGQESAKTIVEAIGDLEQGDQGASIRSIATKHGISINRRGDK